ncbi:MAG: type II toxin-antitoxin system RelE/ParE family toxin [Terricaulis sp.]
MGRKRSVALALAAQTDLDNIAAWTAKNFGPTQAETYIEAILDTIDELTAPTSPLRSFARDEIATGVRTLHMRKRGRRGRHFLLYSETAYEVRIQRVLHDSMELSRHLAGDDG